ncbi:MAG: I78 family peptidase inhibitor [Tabrizicola sp.]|nr:I78 family peptidase inhibitor [Tabrizicola sp.]
MARLALVLALGVTACVAAPDETACGAAGMQGLVGRDRSALAAMSLPVGTRVIEPGTPITEDYRADRLNIDVDARGRITGVWCG